MSQPDYVLAVYPGTFDPVTHGHTDLVARASCMYRKVIVAVAESPHKQPAFSLEKRIALARTVLEKEGLDNVEGIGLERLLVHFVCDDYAGDILSGSRIVSGVR